MLLVAEIGFILVSNTLMVVVIVKRLNFARSNFMKTSERIETVKFVKQYCIGLALHSSIFISV